MLKKMLIMVMLIGFFGILYAEDSLFNFGDFFNSVRVGYGIDQHGQKSEVFYTALQKFHNKNGTDFATLNMGYEGAIKRPAVIMGIRLDNLIPLLWGGEWGKAHVTTAKMPTMEFGPFLSAWPKSNENLWHLSWRYGLVLAIGF